MKVGGLRKTADAATMRRSRRIYQAPDSADTQAASDVENGDVNTKKKNVNNDPAQPLRGSRRGGASTDGGKQPDKRAETSDDSEETDESSCLTRCLCCWRSKSDTSSTVGENCECSISLLPFMHRTHGARFVQTASRNPFVMVALWNLSLIHISEPTRPY